MRICLLLIEKGADVNAKSSRDHDIPALVSAAMMGDLELAALLLREGADINKPGGSDYCSGGRTALDMAASYGRLDMVKFLLSANALSSVFGATGYQGAICEAELMNYLAVADLIREHAAKIEAGTLFNPELLTYQEQCSAYKVSAGDESSDYDYESSSDGHAEDVDAAGGTSGPENHRL